MMATPKNPGVEVCNAAIEVGPWFLDNQPLFS
jgi:hypothetical protein